MRLFMYLTVTKPHDPFSLVVLCSLSFIIILYQHPSVVYKYKNEYSFTEVIGNRTLLGVTVFIDFDYRFQALRGLLEHV